MLTIRRMWEALLTEQKLKWKVLAIALPLIFVARYTLFRDKTEYAAFFENLKLMLIPAMLLAAAVGLWTILRARSRTQAEQQRAANAAFWLTTFILAAGFLFAFAYTKVESA